MGWDLQRPQPTDSDLSAAQVTENIRRGAVPMALQFSQTTASAAFSADGASMGRPSAVLCLGSVQDNSPLGR